MIDSGNNLLMFITPAFLVAYLGIFFMVQIFPPFRLRYLILCLLTWAIAFLLIGFGVNWPGWIY